MEPPARGPGCQDTLDGTAGARAPELLHTGTPREVLARIVPGDPLGLGARLAVRLAERALLVDVERVLLRAQALCAQRASHWRGHPALDSWLAERVDEAIESALSDEPSSAREPDWGAAHPWSIFAAPLGLDGRALSEACARFDRLSFEQREAFFALVLDAAPPDRAARARGLSLSELARRARGALELFRPAALAAPECIARESSP